MWLILGTIIKPYGLTATSKGLCIRIPEVERRDRTLARVFLTDSPSKVLQFLISDRQDEWHKGFPSVAAMFAFAARCQLYPIWLSHEKELMAQAVNDPLIYNVKDSKRSKRNLQREVFARWVNEHLPAQLNPLLGPLYVPPSPNNFKFRATARTEEVRAAVRDAVFKAFPGAEERYNQQLLESKREAARIHVVSVIIRQDRALPAPVAELNTGEGSCLDHLGIGRPKQLHNALIKVVIDGCTDLTDKQGAKIVAPNMRDEDGVLVADNVTAWIRENWERVAYAAFADTRSIKRVDHAP